jgi:hypothetical protein
MVTELAGGVCAPDCTGLAAPTRLCRRTSGASSSEVTAAPCPSMCWTTRCVCARWLPCALQCMAGLAAAPRTFLPFVNVPAATVYRATLFSHVPWLTRCTHPVAVCMHPSLCLLDCWPLLCCCASTRPHRRRLIVFGAPCPTLVLPTVLLSAAVCRALPGADGGPVLRRTVVSALSTVHAEVDGAVREPRR